MNRLRKNRRSDRNSGRIFLLSGAALIIAAALMFGGYLYDGYHTRAYGERILTELLPLIPDRVPGIVPDTIREDDQAVLEVEGVPCAGVLDIPALGKSWPVAGSYYDGSDLVRLAGGSGENGTVVINDADQGMQFAALTAEDEGEKVRFTDIYGRVYTWRITGIVNGEETDMQDSGLVLITRDRMTGERRAVLCTRI